MAWYCIFALRYYYFDTNRAEYVSRNTRYDDPPEILITKRSNTANTAPFGTIVDEVKAARALVLPKVLVACGV